MVARVTERLQQARREAEANPQHDRAAGAGAARHRAPHDDRRAGRAADRAERGAAGAPGGLHAEPAAGAHAGAPAHRRWSSRAASTGATPRRWRSPRCWPTASRSGSPARTPSAAPSASATPVLHDAKTGARYMPLQALPQARASFAIYNSPLSENAALGFEYGYSVHAPSVLVLWEAQFGDFVNGAQVIIDQFIVSGRAKWGQTPGAGAAAAARLRGPGAGALQRAPGALPPARRRRQHPRRELHHRRAVLPPAAPPGAAARLPTRARWWS